MLPDLTGAVVELTAPDGRGYRFRYGAVIPYAGVEYVVLREITDGEDEQILITRVEETPEGLAFVAAEEEDVIEQVYSKYCLTSIRAAVADLPECEDDCCCHDHHHDHHHTCDCGCDH